MICLTIGLLGLRPPALDGPTSSGSLRLETCTTDEDPMSRSLELEVTEVIKGDSLPELLFGDPELKLGLFREIAEGGRPTGPAGGGGVVTPAALGGVGPLVRLRGAGRFCRSGEFLICSL